MASDTQLHSKLGGRQRRIRIAIIALIAVLLAGAGAAGYLFLQHELYQNNQIQNLSNQVVTLNTELSILQNELGDNKVEWQENTYHYLAIGNSITWHQINSYWWNEVGMAASTQDKDYVHVFANMLEDTVGDVDVHAYNFSAWEVQSSDRAETLPLLDPYLDESLDLITIQLGENMSDTTTLQGDLAELVQYIQDRSPNARILVIGQYWQNDAVDAAKQDLCKATDATFVDLSSMFANESRLYNAGMGTTVYDADGNAHTIEHAGVSRHPGDAGMEEMARLVYAAYRR